MQMQVWSDAHVAARTLLRSPGFSLTALLTLVVGMSATTLALTAVNAVLLKPLSVRAPDRVVGITTVGELAVLRNEPVGFGDYADLARDVAAFESVVAHRRMGSVVGTGLDRRIAIGEQVSPNYFTTLGVSFPLGRPFDEADQPGAVVVLGHAAWRRHFGTDPRIIGREVAIGDRRRTVVGIAPEGFTGLFRGVAPEFWQPLDDAGGESADDRGQLEWWVHARLRGRRDARAGSHAGCRPGGYALPAVSALECRSLLCAHAAVGGVHSPRRVKGPCPIRSRRRPRGRAAPAVGLLGQRRASRARARGRRPARGRHPTGGRSQSMADHSSVARRGHPARGRRGRHRVAPDRVGRAAARRDPSAGGAGRHRSSPGARLARLRPHGDRRPRVDHGLVARTGVADLVGPLHRRDAQDRLPRIRGRRSHDVADAADCRPGHDGGVAAGGRRPRVAQPSRRDASRPRLRDARRRGRECRPGAGRPRSGRSVSLPVARGRRRPGASRRRGRRMDSAGPPVVECSAHPTPPVRTRRRGVARASARRRRDSRSRRLRSASSAGDRRTRIRRVGPLGRGRGRTRERRVRPPLLARPTTGHRSAHRGGLSGDADGGGRRRCG